MKTNWTLINFNRVEIVSFDLGYTIVGLDAKQVSALIKKHFGFDIAPATILCADYEMRNYTFKNGDLNARSQSAHFSLVLCELLNRIYPVFRETACIPHKLAAFQEDCREYHDTTNFFDQIYHDALIALETLYRNHIRVIAISNAQGTLDRDLEKYGIRHYFEHVLDSGAEGVSKPDPEIFVRAIDRCGVAAEEILHIGDNPTADVQGALAVGMQAALYDPIGMFPDANGKTPQYRNHMDLVEQLLFAKNT
jgi:HAD superfamily hydrolase (TIGR01549 family)